MPDNQLVRVLYRREAVLLMTTKSTMPPAVTFAVERARHQLLAREGLPRPGRARAEGQIEADIQSWPALRPATLCN